MNFPDTVPNDITQILTKSGDNGIHYDFGEVPPAILSGYVFRDGAPIDATATVSSSSTQVSTAKSR